MCEHVCEQDRVLLFYSRQFLSEGEVEIAAAHRRELDQRNVEYRGRMKSLRNK